MDNNSQISPLDTEFIDQFNKLKQQVVDLQNTRQVLQGDWIQMNIGQLSYASNNTLNTSIDLTGMIQVGDKIKITQSTDKYFYVISRSSTQIKIDGGSDYTFTNAAFTAFSISRITNPSGHPLSFNYTPVVRNSTTTNVLSPTTTSFRYSMQGNEVKIFFDVRDVSGSGPSLTLVDFTCPFIARTESIDLGSAKTIISCTFVSSSGLSSAVFVKTLNSGSISLAPLNAVANTIWIFQGVTSYLY